MNLPKNGERRTGARPFRRTRARAIRFDSAGLDVASFQIHQKAAVFPAFAVRNHNRKFAAIDLRRLGKAYRGVYEAVGLRHPPAGMNALVSQVSGVAMPRGLIHDMFSGLFREI
jgi:hypothetical protein